jgi:tetratricopeptide (TPR) repeat protein
MGLMSKPMLVTVPFVLLLLDYWPLERFNFQSELARIKSLVIEKVPFLILSTASSVVTYLVQGRGHAFDLGRTFGLEVRLGNAAVSYLFYLWKSFWPVKLAAFYPYQSQSDEAALAAVLILLGLTGLCVWRSRVNRAWIVGWLWFVGMLVPVIGLVQVGVQAHADRYMYLPLIGLLLILIGGAMPDAALLRRVPMVGAPLGLAVLACGWLTFRQAALWLDTDTLFRYTLKVAPENPVALHTYGLSLLRQGRNQEAAELYAEAIRVWPLFADAYISLGTALGRQGQTERAMAVYQEALQYSPELLLVHFNLGVLLEQKGKLDEACAHYAEALRISPEYFEALLGLGRVKLAQGEADLALQYFQQAVRLQPKSREARLQTATALAARGDLDQARSELGLAMGVESDSAQAHHQLALALETSHRWPEALNEFKQALVRDPNSAVILNNLAWVLAAHPDGAYRNGSEAVCLAEKARELTRGEQPIILGTLAAAYAETGRFADAQTTAREATVLAEKAGLADLAQKNQELLDLYIGGKPCRDPSLGATQR